MKNICELPLVINSATGEEVDRQEGDMLED
jgi:hypothetical protein